MADLPDSFVPIEPEVLFASFTTWGAPVFRNAEWHDVFGLAENAWGRLPDEDRLLITQCIADAAAGSLVTNQIVVVNVPVRDEPLPVLLNFLPVYLPDDKDGTNAIVQALTITGEVLAEPTSWTVSQTQRHRLEALGRMTMGIAHDFNNLLSGILGYTELLKTFDLKAHHMPYPADEAPLPYLDHVRTIEKAALDGAALVKKLQQYIRQEKQTRFEPVDLHALVQDCVSLTRPYWYNEPRRQGIDIQLVLDLQAVPPVLGSPSELREVFVNLILNSVQAMPQGGVLRISTAFDARRGVRMQVEDNGIGMTNEVRQRIFEPLFTTKGERGTGMGLAVSHGIVQEHDGTIDVVTAPGKGTRFELLFPPAEEAVIATPKASPTHATRPVHILVVDDEPLVRSVLSKLLELRGHTVACAASGPEGLSLAEQHTFDIVLADQAMPEMNGRQFAHTLHHHRPALPVILLTGDTDIGEPDEDIARILGKPFQIDEVEATIQALI